MKVPTELLPAIRELIGKYQSQDSGSYHLFERSAGAMLLEAYHDIEMRRKKAGFVWKDVNWGAIGAS